jgi:hypothetical protein
VRALCCECVDAPSDARRVFSSTCRALCERLHIGGEIVGLGARRREACFFVHELAGMTQRAPRAHRAPSGPMRARRVRTGVPVHHR